MILRLAQEPVADALLDRDPFALLVGMLLDQQQPMERAFAGPARIVERMGGDPARDGLDPRALAEAEPEAFAGVLAAPPAVHRFPGSMAARVQDLARAVLTEHGGDAEAVWREATDGADLLRRLEALPGFGRQKAQVFVALLGKQRGVRPWGWREAAGHYGEDGVLRSVADVVDAETLQRVREAKREARSRTRQEPSPA